MLPHRWLTARYEHCPNIWKNSVEGADGGALALWTLMGQSLYVKKHPHLPRNMWECTVPIGMRGDAGAFSKQESLYVFTWNSLLGARTTMSKRFLMTVIRKKDITPETLDCMLKVMAW